MSRKLPTCRKIEFSKAVRSTQCLRRLSRYLSSRRVLFEIADVQKGADVPQDRVLEDSERYGVSAEIFGSQKWICFL